VIAGSINIERAARIKANTWSIARGMGATGQHILCGQILEK